MHIILRRLPVMSEGRAVKMGVDKRKKGKNKGREGGNQSEWYSFAPQSEARVE